MLGQETTELRLALKRHLENQDRMVGALERIATALELLTAPQAAKRSPASPCGGAAELGQDGGDAGGVP